MSGLTSGIAAAQVSAEAEHVHAQLRDAGLHLKPAWVDEALRVPPLGRLAGLAAEARAFNLALCADLRTAGAGCLPADAASPGNRVLQGRFVLQVDEIVDVSQSEEHRRGTVGNRTLKMMLTDGMQTIAAIEKKKLPELSVLTCSGVKIMVQDPPMRRGIVFLRPENCCVLGGVAPELDKRRLKKIAQEEASRRRTQIVADAESDDDERIHDGSATQSQQAPPRADAAQSQQPSSRLDLRQPEVEVRPSGLGGRPQADPAAQTRRAESSPVSSPVSRTCIAQSTVVPLPRASKADDGNRPRDVAIDRAGAKQQHQGRADLVGTAQGSDFDYDDLMGAEESRDDVAEDPAYLLMLVSIPTTLRSFSSACSLCVCRHVA